jgi:hypothetical protein
VYWKTGKTVMEESTSGNIDQFTKVTFILTTTDWSATPSFHHSHVPT